MKGAAVAAVLFGYTVATGEPDAGCAGGTMKEYLAWLKIEQEKLMQHPFVTDTNATKKMMTSQFNWAPSFAFLSMSFGDLNNVILPYDNPKDEYEEELNKHYEEDGTHFKLYFHDLGMLGWDTVQPVTDTLSDVWNPKNVFVRKYVYSMLARSFEAGDNAFMKYMLLEAFETTVAIFFTISKKNAHLYLERTGNKLQYFGPFHKESEDSHSRDESLFINANVPSDLVCKAYEIATKHFAAFSLLMTQKFEAVDSLDEKWPEPPTPKYRLVTTEACEGTGSDSCSAATASM
jgi:hypothetical protein